MAIIFQNFEARCLGTLISSRVIVSGIPIVFNLVFEPFFQIYHVLFLIAAICFYNENAYGKYSTNSYKITIGKSISKYQRGERTYKVIQS